MGHKAATEIGRACRLCAWDAGQLPYVSAARGNFVRLSRQPRLQESFLHMFSIRWLLIVKCLYTVQCRDQSLIAYNLLSAFSSPRVSEYDKLI
jgi:hypothetical protein